MVAKAQIVRKLRFSWILTVEGRSEVLRTRARIARENICDLFRASERERESHQRQIQTDRERERERVATFEVVLIARFFCIMMLF